MRWREVLSLVYERDPKTHPDGWIRTRFWNVHQHRDSRRGRGIPAKCKSRDGGSGGLVQPEMTREIKHFVLRSFLGHHPAARNDGIACRQNGMVKFHCTNVSAVA